MRGLKVVFMGTPGFAAPVLRALIDAGCDIKGVVTQPDRRAGRGRKPILSPVKELALKEELPIYQPEKVRDNSFVDTLRSLEADVMVVVAYGRILPKAILDIPPMGCINVHASLLPAYRGAAPINWAIARGESVTGITTMMIDEGLDSGDMLLKKAVTIEKDDNTETLYEKLSLEGAKLLIETLEGLKDGSVKREVQDETLVTYAPIIGKEDGLIDWSKPAGEIVNLIRGMYPWPSAHTTIKGKMLKVLSAAEKNGGGKPGAIIKMDKKSIEVAAGKGSLELLELQLEGKKRMKTEDLLRGFALEEGEMLGV
ncbi:MAG: methionyl-tRNA formyltransferase [bacterium]|nr:methionyl-tRNA formyltransferase [bacterium]